MINKTKDKYWDSNNYEWKPIDNSYVEEEVVVSQEEVKPDLAGLIIKLTEVNIKSEI